MARYPTPAPARPKRVGKKTAFLIASGDLRQSANAACWPAQRDMERAAARAFDSLGWKLIRASPERWSDDEPHGFISSQAMGREVFASIDPDAPLVVAEAVWQYSHHVLIGLDRHRGPILLLANWSGQWPGLVGVLNLRACLTKSGVDYSILWGEDFAAPGFRRKLRQWLEKGRIRHDTSHVQRLDPRGLPKRERRLGEALADVLRRRPAILGVFDEGCMGMENAIIPDYLLHAAGAYKERLSQSSLYAAMQRVPDVEARAARDWLDRRGMKFSTGPNPDTNLTDNQVLEQLRMYIAAARMSDQFGCDAIGIQYQQGLKDTCAASDLAEGLLNCSDRPTVLRTCATATARGGDTSRAQDIDTPIRPGRPITHFNEADEGAGLDALITDRVWSAMGLPPDNTLHDLRWGDLVRERDTDTGERTDAPGANDFVWVLEISGAVPPSHLESGYAGAVSERQPPMYFRLGGGTIKGISRPGEVVWSRIFVEAVSPSRGRKSATRPPAQRLGMDIGRCRAVRLPDAEVQRRWNATTPQWPMMNTVFYGVTRDQMMARHQANHIQVVYAPDAETADRALAAKAAMAEAMGIRVSLCGENAAGRPLSEVLARLR